MHLNLVLSHFLSSSHLILPLQCWINFKGHWSQKSLTLALLMDSHHPNAALKSDVYSKLYLLARWRARGVGVVCLFTALLRLAARIFARITASTRCCLPPCNSLLQWNLLSSAGLRAKRENTDVCLWELDGCLTRYIGLYHPRNWSIVSIQKSRNHTRPSRSLQPESPDLVFHGSCLWYFRQSQRSKNTLFFLRMTSSLFPSPRKHVKAQKKLFIQTTFIPRFYLDFFFFEQQRSDVLVLDTTHTRGFVVLRNSSRKWANKGEITFFPLKNGDMRYWTSKWFTWSHKGESEKDLRNKTSSSGKVISLFLAGEYFEQN